MRLAVQGGFRGKMEGALDNIPYSVTEIYGIKSSVKYGSLEPVYHQLYRIYDVDPVQEQADALLVEDSNAGFSFFENTIEGVRCLSAGGASKIFQALSDETGTVMVIADGASFGSQMSRIYQLKHQKNGISLFLPESFEWIILASDVLNDSEVRKILADPVEYINSEDYISWERFSRSCW